MDKFPEAGIITAPKGTFLGNFDGQAVTLNRGTSGKEEPVKGVSGKTALYHFKGQGIGLFLEPGDVK